MYKGKKIAVLIPAGGSGKRFGGGEPKQFRTFYGDGQNADFYDVGGEPELGGSGGLDSPDSGFSESRGARSILCETVLRFLESGVADILCIVAAEDYVLRAEHELFLAKKAYLNDMFGEDFSGSGASKAGREGVCDIETAVFCGGKERQDSVAAGLFAMRKEDRLSDFDYLAIHDAVRPFVSDALIERTLDAAMKTGAATAAVPVKDTIRQNNMTLNRDGLYAVQTPQVFRKDIIIEAYERAFSDGFYGTDDASLVERIGKPVAIAEGDYANIKITTPEDLPGRRGYRTGSGFDVHKPVAGRPLILCGIEIPHEKGLLGHSDADVAAHALMDALLGAAALGDIGELFPDTDPKYEGANSMELLSEVVSLISEKGYGVENVDITIVCEAPKIAPYRESMRIALSERLGIELSAVSVKATTTEGLGFAGRKEGIAAFASVMLSTLR